MSNINNTAAMNNSLFQDLTSEDAAAIQGGIKLYTGINRQGRLLPTNKVNDLSRVPGNFNDTASSIVNDTQKVWAFYTDANYKGRRLALRPGQSMMRLGSFNNQISSYRSEPSA